MRVKLTVAIFVALLAGPIAQAHATEFMAVSELQQLLNAGPVSGTFETVVQGDDISTFDLTVRGVYREAGFTFVVFTTRTHIAAGMSGSPVYVNGLDGRRKLLGAVAYFLSPLAVGEQWGGISPMEYMVAEARDAVGGSVPPARLSYQGKTLVPIALGDQAVPASVIRKAQGDAPLQALLTRSSFSISTRAAGTPAGRRTTDGSIVLRPGMPLMVDLLEWQDAAGTSTVLGATGTVTYVAPDGTVYGFGHPFLGVRGARYNFRTCSIVGTVESHWMSFKLAGEHSAVLGTIDYDGDYGVYGKAGSADQRPVKEFSVDFRSAAGRASTFEVRTASTPLTSLVMMYTFTSLGFAAGVPLPHQASTATLTATVDVEGHQPVEFSQVFVSRLEQFGPMTFSTSSYELAWEAFLEQVYLPLSANKFGIKVQRARLAFAFNDGTIPSLKIVSVRFPPKVKWGTNPALDILLVSEDNSVTLRRRVIVPFDWSVVQKSDSGTLTIASAERFVGVLSERELEILFPPYYLDAADYLAHFRKRLARNHRMLYVRVRIAKWHGGKSSSGDRDEDLPGYETGLWAAGPGLQAREVQAAEDPNGKYLPILEVPAIPPGYVIASVRRDLAFELK